MPIWWQMLQSLEEYATLTVTVLGAISGYTLARVQFRKQAATEASIVIDAYKGLVEPLERQLEEANRQIGQLRTEMADMREHIRQIEAENRLYREESHRKEDRIWELRTLLSTHGIDAGGDDAGK